MPVRRKKGKVVVKKTVAKIFETFHGFPPDKAVRVKIRTLRMGREQAIVGRLAYIGYVSEKWDKKKRLYRHDFKKGPIMLYDAATKMLHIAPGGWKLTDRGIEG